MIYYSKEMFEDDFSEGYEILSLILNYHIESCSEPECVGTILYNRMNEVTKQKREKILEEGQAILQQRMCKELMRRRIKLTMETLRECKPQWGLFITKMTKDLVKSGKVKEKSQMELLLSYVYYFIIGNYIKSLMYSCQGKADKVNLKQRFNIFHHQ
jgi:hypothetical protein